VFASLFVTLYQLKVISQSIWLQLTAAARNVSVTSVTTLLLGYVAVANNEFVLRCLMFDTNCSKAGAIFKILSPGDLQENFLCTHHRDFHFICNVLLHYLVEVKNPKMLL